MPTPSALATRLVRSRVLRIAGTAGGLLLVAHSIDPRAAAAGVRDASVLPLVIGFAVTGIGMLGSIFGWGSLLRAAGHAVPWPRLGALYLQAAFAGQLAPGGVGGDTLRVASMSRDVGYADAVGSLLGSRLAATSAMALWAVPGAIILRGWLGDGGLALSSAFAAAVILLWAVMLHSDRVVRRFRAAAWAWLRRAGELLEPVGATLRSYRSRPGVLAGVLVSATLAWGFNLAALALFARAVDVPATWSTFAVATPVSLLATLAPFSINGLGLREGALIGMLAHAGTSSTHAAVLSVLVDLQTLPFVIAGAVLLATRRRHGGAGRVAVAPADR